MAKKGEPQSWLTAFMGKINWIGYRLKGSHLGPVVNHIYQALKDEEANEKLSNARRFLIIDLFNQLEYYERHRKLCLELVDKINRTDAGRRGRAKTSQEGAQELEKVWKA